MGYGIQLEVWGERACFTRPEMKAERVSYDVITPSAARGIIESIYWKPAIKWSIDQIDVINPIEFETIKRNEVENVIKPSNIKKMMKGTQDLMQQIIVEERQQRTTMLLKNVHYLIYAHFDLTSQAGDEDTKEKHYNIAIRRMRQGQCFSQPFLGTREFDAHFHLYEGEGLTSFYEGKTLDLGWMLHSIDFQQNAEPTFFRAKMVNGQIKTKR